MGGMRSGQEEVGKCPSVENRPTALSIDKHRVSKRFVSQRKGLDNDALKVHNRLRFQPDAPLPPREARVGQEELGNEQDYRD